MDSDQLSAAALRLTRDPAFREIVKSTGDRLTGEVMRAGTLADRAEAALQEYHALQRLVGTIGQTAQTALQKERDADGT